MAYQHASTAARSARPLPPFREPFGLIRAAAEAFRPPGRVTVSECAARHRKLKIPGKYQGPWLNETVPFMVEPMDAMTSRACSLWVLAGPAQWGKSELFLNFMAHSALYRPGDGLLFQPTRDMAKDFASRRVDQQLLDTSPDVAARLGDGRGADVALSKVFRNGTRWDLCWPTAAQLASRSPKTVLIDERDRIGDDIDGEGDIVALAGERIKTHGRDGLVAVASSVSRSEKVPGILALWRRGDQRVLAVCCPGCGDYFTPGFDADRAPTVRHLHIPAGAEPEEAAAAAHLVCDNGCPIMPRQKRALLASGVWVPRGMVALPDGTLEGVRPATAVFSWWLSGLCNPFEDWGVIAFKLVTAERDFERTGDERGLQSVYNAALGMPYTSRLADQPLDAGALEARRSPYRLGTVPAGVRYLTAAVDVGKAKFDVAVIGYDEHGQSWLIDRFTLRQIIRLGLAPVDIAPGTHPEHWLELLPHVIRRRYPLAENPSKALPIACTACDTQGVPGVWDNARKFWLAARRAGVPEWSLMMVKGASVPSAPIVRKPTYEADARGKPRLDGFRWWVIGVNAIKDGLANRLRRAEPGPGYFNLPADMKPEHVAELAGEEKRGDEWVRTGANETFDLAGYCSVASWRLKPHRVQWAAGASPVWATPLDLATAPAPAAPRLPATLAAASGQGTSPAPSVRDRAQPPARVTGRVRQGVKL